MSEPFEASLEARDKQDEPKLRPPKDKRESPHAKPAYGRPAVMKKLLDAFQVSES